MKRKVSFLTSQRLFYIIGILVVVVMVVPSLCVGTRLREVRPTSGKSYAEPPPMTIDTEKSYSATIETYKGNIQLELYPKEAPKTVNNFVFLARDGFYDGLTFYRIVPEAFVQSGDPIGDGSGGPGYTFEDEISSLKHVAGTLSMVNDGPNTNGSQFFICYSPQPQLDGEYTIFGQVVDGMDVMADLVEGDVIKTIAIEET